MNQSMNQKNGRDLQLVRPLVMSLAVAAALSTMQVSARPNALLEEVMVTAQKKSAAEAVQDVPIAISAYSGEQVEAMFAVNLTDIGMRSPNAHLAEQGTVPHTGNFIIRGMGTTGQSIPSSDPAVGVVQDGMPMGLIYGVVTDLFDLESIEILRGPQGTLFGRNVTGGAVVMKTSRPTDEFEGKAKVTVGNFGTTDVSFMVRGALSDSVNGKLAVISKDHDGWWDNTTTGGKHGQSSTLIVRPAVTFEMGDADLTLIAESADISGDGMAPRNFFFDPTHPTVYASAVGNLTANNINPWADNSTSTDKRGDLDMSWSSLVAEYNREFGSGTWTTIASVRSLEQDTYGDIDGAPGTIRFEFAKGSGLEQDQWSIESRWSGMLNDQWSLTAGVNVFSQEYTYRERRLLLDIIERPSSSTIEHDTFGVFAQAEYQMTNAVTLIVGGRYSREDKTADIGVIGDPRPAGSCSSLVDLTGATIDVRKVNWNDCLSAYNDDKSWSNFSPKFGFSWDLSEDIMLYGSASRGFRSGGYNVRFSDASIVTNPAAPNSVPGPYDEEVIDALELGVKSTLMEGRFRLNAAVFHNKLDDMQKSANNQSGVQEIFNAASATIQGFEVDGVLGFDNGITIEFGYGYTDASYDEADYLVAAVGKSASEFKFQMVPERTVSAAVMYDKDLSNGGYISARTAYSYVDTVASDDFNFLILPQYELWDASLTYSSPSDKVKVSLYGRNLKDEMYSHFGFDNSSIGSKTVWLSPPRTYGLELSYSF